MSSANRYEPCGLALGRRQEIDLAMRLGERLCHLELGQPLAPGLHLRAVGKRGMPEPDPIARAGPVPALAGRGRGHAVVGEREGIAAALRGEDQRPRGVLRIGWPPA
jgi:hypothetical protein